MLSYCSNNLSLSSVWVDEGFSPCLYHTLCGSLLALQALLPLSYQTHKMRRQAVPVKALKKSIILVVQWISIWMLLLEALVQLAWNCSEVRGGVSGVDLFYFFSRFLHILLSMVLLRLECKKVFIHITTKRHSFALILSWSSLVMIELVVIASWNNTEWWFGRSSSRNEIDCGLRVTRLVAAFLLLLTGLVAPGIPQIETMLPMNTEKKGTELLIRTRRTEKLVQPSESTWKGLKTKMKLLWPYMWPRGHLLLQFHVLICIVCLIGGRIVNLFIPVLYKNIVNGLTNGSSWHYILTQISLFVTLKFLNGGGFSGGLLNGTRAFLWIPVQQYTTRIVQAKLFHHLHSLSLRWHLSRKTGEVLRSIDRGTQSINTLLSYIMFNVIPTIADIIVAIMFFMTSFNAWFGLIVFVCIAVYLTDTILITEWRTKYRRDMNTKDNKAKQRAIDSLLNFETVKYYNAKDFEVEKYDNAIADYQSSEYMSNALLVLLNTSQSLIISIGMLVGSILCAKFVMDGTFQVGDFVLFGTYIVQLYTPLNFFGTYYRVIQANFIDMEHMFELFDQEEEVIDIPGAITLEIDNKSVEFDNVQFSYLPEQPILKGISFRVNPGETVALVGPSGAGKSTVIRLLFRFYDIQAGAIKIGDTDISTVTQESLRQYIGVVPQDTVLFNDDIQSNIRYGRVTATDQEVENAAKAADIHNKIISFPDGYDTVVGERGLKLSGGEKQRVAIARTILKAPDIILLDEATSSLDTTTERHIQDSLNKISVGKTSIIVAHRLSTVVKADRILVLQDGEIVERGCHESLLKLKGVYAEMWSQQLSEVGKCSKSSKKEDSRECRDLYYCQDDKPTCTC